MGMDIWEPSHSKFLKNIKNLKNWCTHLRWGSNNWCSVGIVCSGLINWFEHFVFSGKIFCFHGHDVALPSAILVFSIGCQFFVFFPPVRAWNTSTYTNTAIYRGHNYPIWDVEFSPYGMYFASACKDHTARLWTLDRTYPLRIFAGHVTDVDVSVWDV